MTTQPTPAIDPQHPRRTCHSLGVCQHPSRACTGRCALALPFEIDGPHRPTHRSMGQRLNDALAAAVLLSLGAVGGYKLGQWVLMALGV